MPHSLPGLILFSTGLSHGTFFLGFVADNLSAFLVARVVVSGTSSLAVRCSMALSQACRCGRRAFPQAFVLFFFMPEFVNGLGTGTGTWDWYMVLVHGTSPGAELKYVIRVSTLTSRRALSSVWRTLKPLKGTRPRASPSLASTCPTRSSRAKLRYGRGMYVMVCYFARENRTVPSHPTIYGIPTPFLPMQALGYFAVGVAAREDRVEGKKEEGARRKRPTSEHVFCPPSLLFCRLVIVLGVLDLRFSTMTGMKCVRGTVVRPSGCDLT